MIARSTDTLALISCHLGNSVLEISLGRRLRLNYLIRGDLLRSDRPSDKL
jgi:hypothetical protein